MGVVVWGHGRSWIVRQVAESGELERCSEWFSTPEEANKLAGKWEKEQTAVLPVEKGNG